MHDQTATADTTAPKCPFSGAATRFPEPRQTPLDPPAQYRTGAPIKRITQWNGQPAWLVTRYADTKKLLLDPRMSSDATNPRYPAQNAALQVVRANYQVFAQMDPPGHTDERRLFVGDFSVRKVEEYKPMIQRIAESLIDGMKGKGGNVDLVADYAMPLPCSTICTILGVPEEDHPKLQAWSSRISLLTITREEALEMMRGFEDYINELIEAKSRHPGDDLLSRLIESQLKTGALTRHKVISLIRLFLVAGHETTTNTLAVGLATLLYHPEQLAKLRADMGLIDSAVEEILRYADVAHSGRLRVAKEDMEFEGVAIKAGEAIIMHQPTANRDPAVFDDPDRFDITRNPKNHLAFGSGIHQCLGHPLARAELRIGLKCLLEGLPQVRPVLPLDELKFQHHLAIYGLESLPVQI